jgi:8-oxo-dGTP pyrophosphatase MutT (NUDIX family)
MGNLRSELRNMLLESNGEKAVGVLIIAEDSNKVLLLKRGFPPHKGHWSLLSGGMEDGENKLETLKREIMEETQIDADEKLDLTFIRTENNNGKLYHYYGGLTSTEIIPTLDDENMDYGWYSEDDLPTPSYPKTKEKIKEICQKVKAK